MIFLYIYEIIIFIIKFLEILADELVINDSWIPLLLLLICLQLFSRSTATFKVQLSLQIK